MVFGLPTPGEPNWDVKLDASIEAVKTTADAAAAEIAGRLSEPSLTASIEAKIIVNAASEQFGTTRDEDQINAAIDYVAGLGGGEVQIFKKDGPWTLGRSDAASNAKGGILVTTPNITLRSDGATFTLTENCQFIRSYSPLGTTVTITADTAITDTTLTVSDTSGMTVGQWVFVRLGQAAYDAAEPDFWLFAKVEAIGSGTSVTLDRPVGYAMSVAATPTANQRAVLPINTLVENLRILGSWRFVNPMTGSANAESGISLTHVRNITIQDVSGVDAGAGVVLGQFVDGMTVRSVRAESAVAQSGQLSKGRVLSLGECRSVTVDLVEAEAFDNQVVLVEGRSEAINIGTVLVKNTAPTRSTTNKALISGLGNARVNIKTLHVTGRGSYLWDTGGTTGCELSIDEAYFHTSTRPNIPDLAQIKSIFYADTKLFSRPRTFRRAVLLTPSMSAVDVALPPGHFRKVRAHATSTTGITILYLGGTGTTSPNLASTLVSGQTVDLGAHGRGFGPDYLASSNTGKRLVITTDGTVPTGTILYVEVDYFADPASPETNASLEEVFGGSDVARRSRANTFAQQQTFTLAPQFNRKSTTTTDASAQFGDTISPVTSSGRVKVILGNTSGVSELILGQSGTNNLLFGWAYNATAASAEGRLETYGGNNPLVIQNNAGALRLGGAAGTVGFYGGTGVAKQTLAAAATDAATTQALANDIRSKLIALGLMS